MGRRKGREKLNEFEGWRSDEAEKRSTLEGSW